MKRFARHTLMVMLVLTGALFLYGCNAENETAPAAAITATTIAPAATPTPTPAPTPEPVEVVLTPQERWGIDEFAIVLLPADEDRPEVVWTREVFADALSEVLYGLPVREFRATSYTAAIEAMRTGHAHVANFGPFSFIQAVDRANAQAFAVSARPARYYEDTPDGWMHGFFCLIITHVDSGIYSLDDLEGRTFGFVDPASTSGALVPINSIINHFMDLGRPEMGFDDLWLGGRFFSSTMVTGSHPNSVQGVWRQDIDAAGVSSSQFNTQVNRELINPEDIRILYTSERIPGNAFAIQGDLPEDLKELVIDFFINWDEQEFWDIRSTNPETRYRPITTADYDRIRELRDRFDLSDD